MSRTTKRNPIAKQLGLKQYQHRVEYSKKGRHPYQRQNRHPAQYDSIADVQNEEEMYEASEAYSKEQDDALTDLTKQAQELDLGYED